ncbi:MAG: hypothetical protein GXP41_03130 [Chloroflexi bacterium]|nr:hypothetical protein [Chloroflexota bacterium]
MVDVERYEKGSSDTIPMSLNGKKNAKAAKTPRGFWQWLTGSGSPDLHYFILPPYEIPDIIVMEGVVVENRGQAPAYNVRITLEYDQPVDRLLHHLRVISEAPYIVRSGGDKQPSATIRLQQLSSHQRVIVYFSSHDQIAPRVKVSSYEKVSPVRVTLRESSEQPNSGE